MKTRILTLLIATVLIAVSCNKDDNNAIPVTPKEATSERKIDAAIDDVSKIVENEYLTQEEISGRNNTPVASTLPPCATVTTVLTDNTWTRTVDFGTDGCELENGNVVKGKIIVSFSNDFDSQTVVIDYTFEDFYHNGNLVQGNRTMTRVRENANGNPQITFEVDMTITFVDGGVFTRQGSIIREWTEGHDTPWMFFDDVRYTTGNWTTTFPSGGTRSGNITTPLKRVGTCYYTVSGVVELMRGSILSVLDYGDGDCNNQATITTGGVTTVITIHH